MDKLTKNISGYLPPEDGPFECQNCHYFHSPLSCELVEGRIEPDGCCNLFTNASLPHYDSEEDNE